MGNEPMSDIEAAHAGTQEAEAGRTAQAEVTTGAPGAPALWEGLAQISADMDVARDAGFPIGERPCVICGRPTTLVTCLRADCAPPTAKQLAEIGKDMPAEASGTPRTDAEELSDVVVALKFELAEANELLDNAVRLNGEEMRRTDEQAQRATRAEEALREMEEGYRERCNYCGGNVGICSRLSAPSGCRAQKARALLPASASTDSKGADPR